MRWHLSHYTLLDDYTCCVPKLGEKDLKIIVLIITTGQISTMYIAPAYNWQG